MSNWQIPLSDIDFDGDEIVAVEDVLKSRWLTMGRVTQEFETAFAAYTGAKHALAVTNATAALHMACMATGLGPGAEVVVPSLTSVASANSMRYSWATPVSADVISEDDINISPAAFESLITEKTRAILLVHYAGYACAMPRILELARKYDLKIIEDAAHAAGAWLDGYHLGTWGDVGCFSFFSNKNMTTGEGGMVVTNDDALYEKLCLLRSHGMTSLTWDRHKGHAWSYDVVDLGYNYRIDEIRAALGMVQLKKLDRNNALRRHLTQVYRDGLLKIDQISVPFLDHSGTTSAHILPILLPRHLSRIHFMEQMKSHGIQTSIHYPPIHKFTSYREFDGEAASKKLSMTEDVAGREVTLPLYPAMTDEQVVQVVDAVAHSLSSILDMVR